jgi:hypothetical protein
MLMVGKNKKFCVAKEGAAPSKVFTLRTIDSYADDKKYVDNLLEQQVAYIRLRYSEDVFDIIVEG